MTNGEIQTIKVLELTKVKKVFLLVVPHALTLTSSEKHLLGFVEKTDELKAKGVDMIPYIFMNNVFSMRSWSENLNVGDKVLLADGNQEFTRKLGVTLDFNDKPMVLGVRPRRYVLLAEDSVFKVLNLEEGNDFTISNVDEIINSL